MLTPTISHWLNEDLWSGMKFEGIPESMDKWTRHVKETEHADIVVGLFHTGFEAGIVDNDLKENQKGPITTIAFTTKEYDFGTIKENVLSNTSFTFTNTGTNPLLVSNAVGSCGCTVPEWPEKPLPPGASGEIKVQFDSKDKIGTQVKTVTVKTNTEPNQTVLIIKANVLAKGQ